MKDGIIYKGYFWPLWGGNITNCSPDFHREGLDGISRTLRAEQHDAAVLTQDMAKVYRIRKLTPKECMRLMGVRDEDTDKMRAAGISESQLYKLAGNSIVVQVLEGIFTQLFRADTENLF